MNLCDSNVWLALALSTHRHHEAARLWFDVGHAPGSVLFCRQTQQTLLRLLTNPAVLGGYGIPPLTNAEAWAVFEALRGDDRVGFVDEPVGLEVQWQKLALRGSASPKLWMDAYLAAFAVAGGHTMVTTDSGFKQFAGLDLVLLG